jgi:hypothetical protein
LWPREGFERSSAVWGRYQYVVAEFVEKHRGYGKERHKLGNKNYKRKRRKETWQNGERYERKTGKERRKGRKKG